MKIELSKKEIKFLYALLGTMSDDDFKEFINEGNYIDEAEKLKINKFVEEQKSYILYKKISEIVEVINE